MTGEALSQRQQQLLHEMFADLPAEFPQRYQHALAIKQAFHSALAHALQHSLNMYLSQQPKDSLEERRELCTNLNRLLRDLNLVIKCPRTGLPATIHADAVSRQRPDHLRFRLHVVAADGSLKATTVTSDLPVPLEFMPLPPRREALARGYRPRGR